LLELVLFSPEFSLTNSRASLTPKPNGVDARHSVFPKAMKRLSLVIIFLILPALIACPKPQVQKKIPALFQFNFSMDTGKSPSFLITDDFTRDKKLDLVVVNSEGHSFSVYKGKGDGTFFDQVVYQTGQDPICVVSADFNADGYVDLAVLNYADQNIEIFMNTRLGGFKKIKTKLKPGKIPINMTTGDFNEDGFPDLAVTLRYHKVTVLRGKGNGRFHDPQSFHVKGQPTGIVVGDYNNDKHIDIAFALAGSGGKGVQLLWGRGDGSFVPSKRFRGGGQPLTIVNLDVNNDGYGDFVTSSNVLHAMTAVINQGDETFKARRDFASGNFPKFVVAADFSGDGLDDIVVSNATDDRISVSLGKGDGTFTYPPVYHPVDEHPQGMAVGDFNGDGILDLAVSCRDKMVIDILLGKNVQLPSFSVPPPQLDKS